MALDVQNVTGLEELEATLVSMPAALYAGVSLVGPAEAYGLVWEWGAVTRSQPGPKTTWGINPDGTRVILTITAPKGWIRVNEDIYVQMIHDALDNINFDSSSVVQDITKAMNMATRRCADLMYDTAPEDTGELKDDILAIQATPDDLSESLSQSYRTLDLGTLLSNT
jgi:hypothetical protein